MIYFTKVLKMELILSSGISEHGQKNKIYKSTPIFLYNKGHFQGLHKESRFVYSITVVTKETLIIIEV